MVSSSSMGSRPPTQIEERVAQGDEGPAHNKWASGSGRLRRPPTQPATCRMSQEAAVIDRRKQTLETRVMGRFGGPER